MKEFMKIMIDDFNNTLLVKFQGTPPKITENKNSYIIKYNYMASIVSPHFPSHSSISPISTLTYMAVEHKDILELKNILNISTVKISLFGIKIKIGYFNNSDYVPIKNKIVNSIIYFKNAFYPFTNKNMHICVNKRKFLKYKILKKDL